MKAMRFQQLQWQFTRHIRDPKEVAPAGIDPRRLQLYRELMYNNIESFLSSSFPVLRSLINDADWHSLVGDFFSRHKCTTPYFLEISQEFLRYLQEERESGEDDLPFLLELAHYEWLELAADVDLDVIPASGFNPHGDLLHGKPVLSPLVYVAAYDYPVHRIGPDFVPLHPGEQSTCLVIYRDHEDQVRFMEINPVTARLLQLLQEQRDASGADVIDQIQTELQHPDPGLVREGGRQALQELHTAGIILGTELKPL